jgi:hypothetical protein
MHVKIVTFTRESTDVPFFTRERDMHFYFTTLHLDGKILLEKRSFSDDMLVYTRETHWKSKEEYDTASTDETMIEFRKARDKYLCENNIVMTDVS